MEYCSQKAIGFMGDVRLLENLPFKKGNLKATKLFEQSNIKVGIFEHLYKIYQDCCCVLD